MFNFKVVETSRGRESALVDSDGRVVGLVIVSPNHITAMVRGQASRHYWLPRTGASRYKLSALHSSLAAMVAYIPEDSGLYGQLEKVRK